MYIVKYGMVWSEYYKCVKIKSKLYVAAVAVFVGECISETPHTLLLLLLILFLSIYLGVSVCVCERVCTVKNFSFICSFVRSHNTNTHHFCGCYSFCIHNVVLRRLFASIHISQYLITLSALNFIEK